MLYEKPEAPSMNEAQKFIFVSRYARWLEDQKRRESDWSEAADRYFGYMRERFESKVPKAAWQVMAKHVYTMGTMPSMRSVWGAGEALAENNIIGYNCCYLPIVDLRSIVEVFYILMCGTGVGFSVENEYISRLPVPARWTPQGVGVHVVGDSREGWAISLLKGLETWFAGKDIEFDYSRVRPRGARLKKMGGRASGPDPLRRLHEFCRATIKRAEGRKLTSLEVLDICNMVGEVVVVGGVRRSSEISFSDLGDDLIRHAKTGEFPEYRFMSNNSAAYFAKPDIFTFMKEWQALGVSGRGERGIYNIAGIEKHLKENASRRQFSKHLRANPCGEILLKAGVTEEHVGGGQFCNLTEVVVRATDDFDDLIEKVEAAVWLGVMQASQTNFPFIRPEFKKNCEEERLLGVSLTGQMDNPKLMTEEHLRILKKYAIKVCRKACKAVGINMSVAITTGKPSGTVSQLVDAASGAHPRHAPYYIRRYRLSSTDALFRMMRDQGVKFTPENGQGPEDRAEKRKKMLEEGYSPEQIDILAPAWTEAGVETWVCSFPVKAPKGAITREKVTALDQLEWYLKVQKNWCEHNQSITVYVRDDEWLKVGAWVYDHFDDIVGISFLPYDGGRYEQAPYEEISREEYERLAKEFPTIDYTKLSAYEMDDNTTGAQQLACVGDRCEI